MALDWKATVLIRTQDPALTPASNNRNNEFKKTVTGKKGRDKSCFGFCRPLAGLTDIICLISLFWSRARFLSRSAKTYCPSFFQMLPPPLPPVFPPLLLISPCIRKKSSISFCRWEFLRSASALALSMFRILISATLWLRLCCSRLRRKTATCLSRTSLLRSNLWPTESRQFHTSEVKIRPVMGGWHVSWLTCTRRSKNSAQQT